MLHSIILAAGRGTRFKSALPKVLHPLCGQPMLSYVIGASKKSGAKKNIVVVPEPNAVSDWLTSLQDPNLIQALQPQPRGTGDALKAGMKALEKHLSADDYVLVLSGDVPLMSPETLTQLLRQAQKNKAAVAVGIHSTENPFGYGRIIGSKQKSFFKIQKIIEEKDATAVQKRVRLVNAGLYCFHVGFLQTFLPALTAKNAQGEYYLTDLIALSHSSKIKGARGAVGFQLENPIEAAGVNDRRQLAELARYLQRELIHGWMDAGVTFENPETCVIEMGVKIESDVTIGPNVKLTGTTVLASGVTCEGVNHIHNTHVGSNVTLKWGTVTDGSMIGASCVVGPYARLRPGTELEKNVRIGNFVETKKAVFGENSKASHLSYLGDATIGANVNIGCGVITCNYDGVSKHQTLIEDDVFIGSDSQLVAPVTVGRGSYVASGSTVTKNVPPDALAIARTRQENKIGFAEKIRRRKRGTST